MLKNHSCELMYAGIAQDNKYIVSGSLDGIVNVWDL
jgi:WD40 repeat protein